MMENLYVVVKGGMVQEIYSTMSSQELISEVLDFDGQVSEEEEKERDFRYRAIRELMYRID